MEVDKETATMEVWNRETAPTVMKIVCTRLPQRDLISLLLVSPWIHGNLISHPSLWQVLLFFAYEFTLFRLAGNCGVDVFTQPQDIDYVLDFHEMDKAGDRLLAALSLSRYQNVKHIKLEFARDIEDKHLEIVKNVCRNSVGNLEVLNLNGCQKISDAGIDFITFNSPKLKDFSIYWNVRVSDLGIKNLVKNCKLVTNLNLSGCKNVSDESLKLIAKNYQGLVLLNITRCTKLTDGGLQTILLNCSSLQSLNLYALSSFTDVAYQKISLLIHLQFLDLCGAQNLSDEGLSCIANCKSLISLNLTWCVRVTDQGVVSIAQGCTFLEFLSLFGIVGVTDKSLEALSRCCSNTITTLDVNGCIGIKRRSREELIHLFPKLKCFKVHS